MTQKRMSNQLMRFVTLLLAVLLCQPTTLPLLAQSAGSALNATIVTVAGGGLFANVAAKQAPLMSPTAVLADPAQRGFYILDGGATLNDLASYGYVVRFVNTSAQAVTIGSVTIEAGAIGRIAGGGSADSDDVQASLIVLDTVPAMAI